MERRNPEPFQDQRELKQIHNMYSDHRPSRVPISSPPSHQATATSQHPSLPTLTLTSPTKPIMNLYNTGLRTHPRPHTIASIQAFDNPPQNLKRPYSEVDKETPLQQWYADNDNDPTFVSPGSRLSKDHPQHYSPINTNTTYSNPGSLIPPNPHSPSTQEATSTGPHTPPRIPSPAYRSTHNLSPWHTKSRSSSPGLYDPYEASYQSYAQQQFLTSWAPLPQIIQDSAASPVSPHLLGKKLAPPPAKRRKIARPSRTKRQRHSQHERPFHCSFYFAGCKCNFATKNEWKRHVSTMHMQDSIWRCDIPACQGRKQTVFNRKDLFGQHIKRMHMPVLERDKPHFLQIEAPAIQERCRQQRRQLPTESMCGFCDMRFSGSPSSWNDRMEHVGRHYENAAVTSEDVRAHKWKPDQGLIKWALKEGLVVLRDNQYHLVGMGKEAVMSNF